MKHALGARCGTILVPSVYFLLATRKLLIVLYYLYCKPFARGYCYFCVNIEYSLRQLCSYVAILFYMYLTNMSVLF